MCYILVWVVVIGVVCFELVEWIIEIVWVILFIMCIWVWLLSEVGVLDQCGFVVQLWLLWVDVKYVDVLLVLWQFGWCFWVELFCLGLLFIVWLWWWWQLWVLFIFVVVLVDYGEFFVDVIDLEVLLFLSVSLVDYWVYWLVL